MKDDFYPHLVSAVPATPLMKSELPGLVSFGVRAYHTWERKPLSRGGNQSKYLGSGAAFSWGGVHDQFDQDLIAASLWGFIAWQQRQMWAGRSSRSNNLGPDPAYKLGITAWSPSVLPGEGWELAVGTGLLPGGGFNPG